MPTVNIKDVPEFKMTKYVDLSDDSVNKIAEVVARKIKGDEVEVVRCKDCKWWSEDDNGLYGYCMAMKHGYMSANWEIGIYRKYKGDFYCADGERIGDEVE